MARGSRRTAQSRSTRDKKDQQSMDAVREPSVSLPETSPVVEIAGLSKIIFVDYENVHRIKLESIKKRDTLVLLFVGRDQNKIPFELVQSAQDFGDNLRWVKIEGAGRNNLDFHIAYEMGVYNQTIDKKVQFIILSKDTGYDSLIRYVNRNGRICKRINSITELTRNVKNTPLPGNTIKVLENLKKIQPNKRPRTRRTLIKHVESLFQAAKEQDVDAEAVVDDMFMRDMIRELNNKIRYNIER